VEAEEQLGGLAALWRCGDCWADLGPHRLYTELPEIAALLPQLLEGKQTIEVERRSQLFLEGHFYDYPVRAGELLQQMGLFRVGWYGMSAAAGILGRITGRPQSYAQAMRQAFGSALYKKIIEPYTRKVWKTDPEMLSEEVARVRVSAGGAHKIVQRILRGREEAKTKTALDKFTYIRGGVEGLVHALEAKVLERGGNIEPALTVSRLCVENNLVKCVLTEPTSENASEQELEATAVISTMPITELVACLHSAIPSSSAQAARGLEYVGMILVGIELAKPRLTPNTWLYFPEEHIVFNRAYEPKNFDEGAAPPNTTFVVFEVTAKHSSSLWKQDAAAAVDLVIHDASRAGLFLESEVLRTYTKRIPYAYPIYDLRFRENLRLTCAGLQQVKNLITTGRQGLFNHNNMDHSMLMGIRAAECLLGNPLSAAEKWYASLGQFDHFRIVD